MANTESTAVNALIELSNQRPVDLGLGGDPFANSFGANAAHRNVAADIDVEVDMSADAFETNPRATLVGMPGPRRPVGLAATAMPPPLPAVLRPSRQMAASDVTTVNTVTPPMKAHVPLADENWAEPTQVGESRTEPVSLGFSDNSAMQPSAPPVPMARNRVPASTSSMPFAAQAQQFNEAASSRASQSFGVPALTSVNIVPHAPVLPTKAAVARPTSSRAGSDTQLVAPLPPPTATELTTSPRQLLDGSEWYESTQAVPRAADEYDVNTHGVKHARRTSPVVIGGVAGAAVLGALAGGYFFFGLGHKAPAPIAAKAPIATKAIALNGAMPAAAGQDNTVAPAIAITAAPTAAPIAPTVAPAAAAPAPTVTPIEAAAASPLSDVTFTSQPAGANVVIVDEGKPMQLGKTPITASIDVRKAYDVVFALDGHPTKMATLAVGATTIAADLDSTAPATPTHVNAKPAAVAVAPVAATKTEEAAPVTHKKAQHEQVAAVAPEKHHAKRVAEADDAPAPTKSKKSSKAEAAQELAAPKGPAGTLMIASKPPCAISVDGKSTGLTTPQRDLQLAAGTHTISLVNAENGIRKTVKVTIVSGKATKAMLDFTSLLNGK